MTESVIEEYAHSCRIVEEEREGDSNQYHYEGPMGRIKTFENPDKARLYADVHTVTGGFREEKTGERGAPPTVAQSRGDVLGLLESMDRLPNRMSSLIQILYTENISLPSRYQEDFQNLALINVEAVREAVLLMRSFIQALEGLSERIQRIGQEESASDELERRLIYDLFRTDELNDFQRIILRDLFLELGAISDFAENFADRVGVCSVKRLF